MSTIIAIIKAIPIIKEWFDKLWYQYLLIEHDSLLTKNREGVKKLVEKHDQRDIEKQIGSTKVGLPSGHADAVLFDSVPGVRDETGN
jgi:hypothetical protein